MPETMSPEAITDAAEKIIAAGECAPRLGRDPVNQPMINNWVEALGDRNPIYVNEDAARVAGHPGTVAPPAMAQVWTMFGLNGSRPADDPMAQVTELLDSAGYTSVVATDCEQTYHRYVNVGEQVSVTSRLSEIRGPKQTALGEGWFVTFQTSWHVGDETVAEMLFRLLKFAPGSVVSRDIVSRDPQAGDTAPDAPAGERVKPVVSWDTEFFWAGTRVGELRIQRLPDSTLRHPPIPALWQDKSEQTDYVVASGRGVVFSYVVHHAPEVPGRQLPFVVALVELAEGVRMLGELRGIEPAEVKIGLPVQVEFEALDDDTVLPVWRVIA